MIASDTQTDRQNDADENNTSPKTKFLGEVTKILQSQSPHQKPCIEFDFNWHGPVKTKKKKSVA